MELRIKAESSKMKNSCNKNSAFNSSKSLRGVILASKMTEEVHDLKDRGIGRQQDGAEVDAEELEDMDALN
jgi:hypothetical protein